MKTKQLIISILLITFLFSGIESMAQRRVVSTPRRTVVQTPRGTVVYRKHPVVRTVHRLPHTTVVVHHNGSPFYFSNGTFYAARNGTYVRIAPPVGIRVTVLPAGCVRVVAGITPFFYFGGIFYTLTEHREYMVVDPPVGAMVSKLPADASEVEIEGKPYYEFNGTLYKQVQGQQRLFEVVGKLDN